MAIEFKPWPYQYRAIDHLMQYDHAGLFMEMGLGKSVVSLTAADKLLYEEFKVKKVLVIAPKFVAQNTWTAEAAKWEHLKHLRVNLVLGDAKDRIAALRRPGDIWVINRESVAWLQTYLQSGWDFDCVIIDESSSFKNHAAKRFRALRMVLGKIKHLYILTGTPGQLLDLWAQVYLLDRGERLYDSIMKYRSRYFQAISVDGMSFKYVPWDKEAVYDKIKDICISMSATDYLDMPELVKQDVIVNFSDDIAKMYKKFKRDQILPILDQLTSEDRHIRALSAAALNTKLLQFTGGAVYDENKEVHQFHTEKLEALDELLEAAQDEPVMVMYWFQHELSRLRERYPHAVVMDGSEKTLKDWNDGKIQLLLCHPGSMAYGLNMQQGGGIMIWYSMTYQAELVSQVVARLWRQGQTRKQVRVFRLIVKGTRDQNAVDNVDGKVGNEQELMAALKADVDEVMDKKPRFGRNNGQN